MSPNQTTVLPSFSVDRSCLGPIQRAKSTSLALSNRVNMYNAANQRFDNGNIPHPRRPISALHYRCFQLISNLRFRGRRSNPIWRRPEQLRKTCMIFCRSKTATIHVIDTHLKAQICCPSNIIPIKYEIPFRSP